MELMLQAWLKHYPDGSPSGWQHGKWRQPWAAWPEVPSWSPACRTLMSSCISSLPPASPGRQRAAASAKLVQETRYAIFPVPYVEDSLGMPLSNGKARADCFERQRRLVIPLLYAADDAV